jgi:hypothetical protein
MADFAAGDVTVTINRQTILRGSPGGLRFNRVKIQFGDGALTYNTGGVPLPTFPKFGMVKRIDDLIIVQNGIATIAYVWTYDPVNHKLIAIEEVAGASSVALAELADAVAIAAQTLYAIAIGW